MKYVRSAPHIRTTGSKHPTPWSPRWPSQKATTAVFEGNMTFGLLGCGIEFRGDRAMMILNRDGYAIYEERLDAP